MRISYKEPRRYLANAREILREKAGRENGFYLDKKYVRMAGNTAWNGVLEAVETWLVGKGVHRQKKSRPDVEWYQTEISRRNRKLNQHFVSAYNILHRYLGYDGELKASLSKDGLDEAAEVIKLCERDS